MFKAPAFLDPPTTSPVGIARVATQQIDLLEHDDVGSLVCDLVVLGLFLRLTSDLAVQLGRRQRRQVSRISCRY
jgi:hypothetical protein